MDNTEKYNYWEEYAQYDFDTADVMFNTGRYIYSVFMCQQAIEKIVKGLFVLYTGEEPIRSHNISLIFSNLCSTEKFRESIGEENLKKHKDEYDVVFVRLLAFYISERYPNYKEKISSMLTKSEAQEILTRTKEVFIWLQSLRKFY